MKYLMYLIGFWLFTGCYSENQSNLQANDENLLGVWRGECDDFGDDLGGLDNLDLDPNISAETEDMTSSMELLKVLPDVMNLTQLSYDGHGCSGDQFDTTVEVEAGYTTQLQGEFQQIDTIVKRIWVTPMTQSDARLLRREKVCEFQGWKLNEKVEVTNMDCNKTSDITKNSKGFDIYKIKEGILQFGLHPRGVFENGLGKSADKRPKKLFNYKYSKQN